MRASKTLDFAAKMKAMRAAAEDKATKKAEAAEKNPNLVPVRSFNAKGIKRLEELLADVRKDKQLYEDEMAELLTDSEFVDDVNGSYKIDPTRVFTTKLELCKYFVEEVFTSAYLESSEVRTNSGLWTWIALAYYKQFAKVKKDAIAIAANAHWIYDVTNYRLSMRHYIAGAVYLYYDFRTTDDQVKELLFWSAPQEFGGFIDAITYKKEGTRLPALMQVAAWLYYDPAAEKKIKKGVIAQDKPGTVRQFVRVAAQLAETRDFYGVEDASELWSILPGQFDGFKGAAIH